MVHNSTCATMTLRTTSACSSGQLVLHSQTTIFSYLNIASGLATRDLWTAAIYQTVKTPYSEPAGLYSYYIHTIHTALVILLY